MNRYEEVKISTKEDTSKLTKIYLHTYNEDITFVTLTQQ